MENAERVYRNLHKMANYYAIIDIEEVNYLLEKYSDLVVCNGSVRYIAVESITGKKYKIYTKDS